MSGETQEVEQRQLLLIVESAQRAGFTETEIVDLVDAAIEADAELERRQS
jgi:hypothetical protein